jgi:hypothetical protein
MSALSFSILLAHPLTFRQANVVGMNHRAEVGVDVFRRLHRDVEAEGVEAEQYLDCSTSDKRGERKERRRSHPLELSPSL